MTKKTDKLFLILFTAAVLVFLLAFFIQSTPATVFNTDDWCFITDTRGAYPIWKALNPCRVLPEILGPLSTWLAMHLVYPLTKNIIGSLSIMSGIFMGISITVYVLLACYAVKKVFQLNTVESILIAAVFLIFHFMSFRKEPAGNMFVFHSMSFTHIFFYALPNIINASLVLLFLGRTEFKRKGVLLLFIYLAMLSNLYASIALPAFLAAEMILDMFGEKKGFFKRNTRNIIIIAFWMVVQIFEAFGGRAASLATEEPFFGRLSANVSALFSMIYHSVNHMFLFFSLLVVVVAAVLMMRNKDKEYGKIFLKLVIALLITFVYVLLITTKANALIIYFGIIFEILFYSLVIVAFALAYICRTVPKTAILLPILCCVFIVESNTAYETYNAACSIPTVTARRLDDYIISQVMEADAAGEKRVEIHVPYYGGYDNFPMADYGAQYVTRFLHKYRFISTNMEAVFVPDPGVNEMFGLS